MRRQRLAVLGSLGALGLYAGCWAAIIPAVKLQVHASDGVFGAALLVGSLGTIPGTLVLGPALARAHRAALPVALTLYACTIPWPGLVTGSVQLAVALFVNGAAAAGLLVATNCVIIAHEQRDRRPMMQQAHGIFPLCLLGSSLATGAARALGAKPTLALLTMALGVIGVAVANLGALAPRTEIHRTARGVPLILAFVGALGAMSLLVELSVTSWSAVQVERTLRGGPLLAAAAPALIAAAMAFSRLRAHGQVGRRGDAAVMLAGVPIAALGVAMLSLAPVPVVALAGCAAIGLGIGTWAPAVFGIAGRVGESIGHGAAMEIVTTMSFAGVIVGPFAVGALSSQFGLRTAMVALVGPVALLGILLRAAPTQLRT